MHYTLLLVLISRASALPLRHLTGLAIYLPILLIVPYNILFILEIL